MILTVDRLCQEIRHAATTGAVPVGGVMATLRALKERHELSLVGRVRGERAPRDRLLTLQPPRQLVPFCTQPEPCLSLKTGCKQTDVPRKKGSRLANLRPRGASQYSSTSSIYATA